MCVSTSNALSSTWVACQTATVVYLTFVYCAHLEDGRSILGDMIGMERGNNGYGYGYQRLGCDDVICSVRVIN